MTLCGAPACSIRLLCSLLWDQINKIFVVLCVCTVILYITNNIICRKSVLLFSFMHVNYAGPYFEMKTQGAEQNVDRLCSENMKVLH